MIKSKEISYKKYGRCLQISNGKIEVVVSVDFGPRILSLKTKNGENMLFNDENDKVCGNEDARKLYKEKMGIDEVWHLYGGHRMWISPEIIPTACYPDNHPVNYKLTADGVKIKCDLQKYTNLLFETEIKLIDKTNEVSINGKITNKGAFDANFAPWLLTVMDKGGIEILPLPQKETGLLPNTYLTVWSYTKLNDKRIDYLDKYITIKQDVNSTTKMKIGIKSENGWAAYVNKSCLFVKYFDAKYENGVFPDNGVNYETYTNNEILEMESLGEITSLKPNKSVKASEKWKIFDLDREYNLNDEAEIDCLVKKYIM